jgi:hypothetical protein
MSPSRWLPWPAGRRVAVFEETDASLLFTARRIHWLWPVVVVSEADGNLVARIHGPMVTSPSHRFLAQRSPAGTGRAGTFVSRSGAELIRWEAEGVGTVVHFIADVRHEPFVKMALLAAVLTLDTR